MNQYSERLQAIEARKEELRAEVGKPETTTERIAEITTEADTLRSEEAELRDKLDLTGKLSPHVAPAAEKKQASNFKETRHLAVTAEETRSVLISGGTLATPTQVSGINEKQGAKVSSVVDLVNVANCDGMAADRVAYVSVDAAAASAQTEGSAATAAEPTYAYIDITPSSIAVTAQISKQAKKQSPLQYENNVKSQSLTSLRKKASAKIVDALKASALVDTVTAEVASSKGVINEKTLRKLVMSYGGDEGVDGAATLLLNKADLIAFGDVRGTNEKKAVYEITPDAMNPNTGIIKDGGLAVPYCINSNITVCSGTAQAAEAKKTMFYGQMQNFKLDLFSQYEVRVSEDFAFTSLMDTIVGDVEIGGDVVVKGGFVCLIIPATT